MFDDGSNNICHQKPHDQRITGHETNGSPAKQHKFWREGEPNSQKPFKPVHSRVNKTQHCLAG